MSMTGYGRGEMESNGFRYLVEIRSVNHRFLEVVVRLPHGWMALEEGVRKQVQQVVRRGRVDVFISVEGTTPPEKKVQVDWGLVKGFLTASRELEKQLGISARLTVADLIHKPEFWVVEEAACDVENHREALFQAVQKACLDLKEMRNREGEHLGKDLAQRMQGFLQQVAKMKAAAPRVVEQMKQRIQTRMEELLEGRGTDPDRLLMEVAIFADRADITEELTRLSSHAGQFLLALTQTEPVGRRLDFLLQEMNREINTIGSKANDQQIGALVVECKSELEKMKEQVQNIE